MRMGIRDRRTTNGHPPRGAIDHAVVAKLPLIQRHRRCKRLQGRTGLEGIGHSTIAQLGARKIVTIIRVVGWQIGQRQNFASFGIKHNNTTSFSLILFDRLL